MSEYLVETLSEDRDDGTMPRSRHDLAAEVVGHRIVSAEVATGLVLTLDNGKRVRIVNTDDCCAFTELRAFFLHPESVDHVITGVGTTGEYTTWHIYADWGDVMTLDVEWSCGNPFYYGYGFNIYVESA